MAEQLKEHIKRSGKCDHAFYRNADGNIRSNPIAFKSSARTK